MEQSERPKSPKGSQDIKKKAALRKLQKMKWVQVEFLSKNWFWLRKLNFSQEQIAEALKKKKECNKKAQKVVEKLIDPFEGEKEFLELLKDINQSHYEDIVEERAIMKLCGFPLCKDLLEM